MQEDKGRGTQELGGRSCLPRGGKESSPHPAMPYLAQVRAGRGADPPSPAPAPHMAGYQSSELTPALLEGEEEQQGEGKF